MLAWLTRLYARLFRAKRDPYLEGMQTCDQGREPTSNPYPEFTEHWEDWREGWEDSGEYKEGDGL